VYARVYVNVPGSNPFASIPTTTTSSETTPAPTETPATGSTCSPDSTSCPDVLPFDTSFAPYGCTFCFSSLSFSRR
jgi:hypothetical protein